MSGAPPTPAGQGKRPDETGLSDDFKAALAARRMFGRPEITAARADPAAARARAGRFIASFAASAPLAASGELPVAGTVGPVRFRYFQPAGGRQDPGQVIYLHGGGLVFYELATFAPVLS